VKINVMDIAQSCSGNRRWAPRSAAAATRTRVAAVAIATATASTVALAPPPAQSAASTECPTAYPVDSLARGQAVTGLTVSEGTEPDGFTGQVIGVLNDGIMPGLDMIMVRLSSPEIDRVGIWAGMSGSPVYAEDGRLIGAVSYGLAFGPSPVAGVTPAADMQQLLDDAPASTLKPARRVDIPERMEDRIAALADVSATEADGGLSQLRLPFAIGGVAPRRFDQVVDRLNLRGMRPMRSGTATGGDADATDIRAGGNIGAAVSYGDISFAGIGTATAVCGEDVLAFGHPMLWTGPASLSLHSADALYVQDDAFVGFKVANLGGPVGTVDQDRIAGIAGTLGPLPPVGEVTSTARTGTRERTGTSHVNLPEWMPDVAFTEVLTNEDRIFDGVGKGSAQTSWQVRGTREDGTPFEIRRSDVYADPQDLTFATVLDLYTVLSALEFNGEEDVTLDSVTSDAKLSRAYRHATIDRVSVRRHGRWVRLGDEARRVRLRAGHPARFRVRLDVVGEGPSSVVVELPVRRRDAGRRGFVAFTGGSTAADDVNGGTVDSVIKRVQTAPRNDDVITRMSLSGRPHLKAREVGKATGVTVDGGLGIRIRIVR
jgi:hypothetical protein